MSFFDTLTEMLVLLFTIAMGFTANRLGILGGETDQKISKLLLCLTLPAMLLGSVCTGDALPETSVVLGTLGVAVVFYCLEFAFVLAVPPLLGGTPGQQGVWRYTLAFPNVAFIGYPVVTALFGAEALFYAVILVLPFNLMTFTLGPLLLTGAKRFSLRQMLSPCVLASALGKAKDTVDKTKRPPTDWKRIFTYPKSDRGLISYGQHECGRQFTKWLRFHL